MSACSLHRVRSGLRACPSQKFSVPYFNSSIARLKGTWVRRGGKREDVLMRHEDLEPANHLRQGDRAIVLPVLDGFHVVDHDYKVLIFALVVDFGLMDVSASHVDSERVV